MKSRLNVPLAVLVFFLAFSLILSGCGMPKPSTLSPTFTATATEPDDTDTPEPTSPPTFTPVPTQKATPTPIAATFTALPTFSPNAASKALVDAFMKLSTAYPYRLVETSRGAYNLDRTTDYAAADQVHSSWVLAPNPDQREMITLGGLTWWKINGKWDSNPSDTNAPLNLYALLAPNVHDVKYIGQENANGVPCFLLSYALTINTSGVSIAGAGNAWIGISDGLPHQLDLKATVNNDPLTTQLVYSYGVKLDIRKPIP